jgi:DNA-binding beta-propeller fold protein YncE
LTSVHVGSLTLALLFLIILGGCLPPGRNLSSQPDESLSAAQYGARLNSFLTLKDDQGPALRLEFAGLEILADDLWLPLTQGSFTIDSAAIGTGQMFLGGVSIPPGSYHRLRMMVTKAEFQKAGGGYTDIVSEPFLVEIPLAESLNIEPEDSRSLLFSWDVQSSLQPDNSLQLALTATPPARQFLLDLVFVSCPNVDTIFVIRADKNWVVDSFGLPGRPTYMSIDPDALTQRLYVLTSGDKMVKVVDLSSFRVVDFFPIPLNDEPTFMTVGAVDTGGQAAFLLDERSGYLSRMDLSTGRSVARVQLNYQPKYAAYLSEQKLLAVSLSRSQQVLLLDPDNLTIMGTITTGNTPQGLIVSDNQLYIAESGSNTVSISDLSSGRNQGRLAVGFGPRRLLTTGNQIYVSNFQDGSLSVLVPGQLGVFQDIYGLGRPQEMVFDQFYRRLYVADEEARGLAVIDAGANLFLKYISLGAKPFGMAVIQ